MVLSAVSMVSSFEADEDTHDLVGEGEKIKNKKNKTNNNYMLRCTILTQFDLEWKRSGEKLVQLSCFIQTAKKQSGSYLVVSTHILGRVHILSAKIDEVVR